jgi:hypothetical protein
MIKECIKETGLPKNVWKRSYHLERRPQIHYITKRYDGEYQNDKKEG